MTVNFIYICINNLTMGYITSGIGFDTDLWNEMEHLRTKEGLSRSQYIQTALRRYNKQIKCNNIDDIVDGLDESELTILKEKIKKRSH